jgi:hypothetical protein
MSSAVLPGAMPGIRLRTKRRAMEALPSGNRKYCSLVGVITGNGPPPSPTSGHPMPWNPGKPLTRAISAGKASLPIPQYPCCQVWKYGSRDSSIPTRSVRNRR